MTGSCFFNFQFSIFNSLRLGLAAMVMFLAALPAHARLTAGDHRFLIAHRGLTRSYLVHMPTESATPLPLVINFHGGGGNGAGQQRFSGMDATSDRHLFIVVYPDGTGRMPRFLTWNAGTCCGSATVQQVDDVGFVRALVADLEKKTPIDRRRIYATGMSNGGMMSYRMAAEAGDLVAAVAPVAGSMTLVQFHPSRAVPILHIHSVDDPRALYNGGLGPPFPMTSSRVEHPPVEQQLRKWISFEKCSPDPVVALRLVGSKGSADEGNTAKKYVYSPCANGSQIVLWKLTGSGHVWPGGHSHLERLLGKPTDLFSANEEIWNFLSKFTLSK